MKRKLIIIGTILIPLLGLPGMTGCSKSRSVPIVAAPEVGVDIVEKKEVQLYLTTQGQTVAYEEVDVVARVPGFLERILFTPGKLVRKGDPLYLIEQAVYKIALDSAEAQLLVDQAKEPLARANLDRARELREKNTISAEEYETRASDYKVALATIERSKTAVEQAKNDLGYTEIFAPISGKTSKKLVDVGNYVGQGGAPTHLVTITQMDPILVDIEVNDRQFREYNKASNFIQALRLSRSTPVEGVIGVKSNRPVFTQVAAKVASDVPGDGADLTQGVTGSLPDDSELQYPFEISFLGSEKNKFEFQYQGNLSAIIENEIEFSTAKIYIRGEIPNPNFDIYPGQVCRVRIPLEKVPDAVLVREEAIMTDLDTKYVFVVVDKEIEEPEIDPVTHQQVLGTDGKPVMKKVMAKVAERRTIKLGRLVEDNRRIITEGLDGGEAYIVRGLQRTRDNAPVKIMAEQGKKSISAHPENSSNPTKEVIPAQEADGKEASEKGNAES